MNTNFLTLAYIHTKLFSPNTAVLMDGETVVSVDEESLKDWRQRSNLDLPIFASEIDEHMLEEWKFAFLIGAKIESNELTRATMSKPYKSFRNSKSWGGSVSPCRVRCDKCSATYPIWGKFVLGNVQICGACNYKYEFIDI